MEKTQELVAQASKVYSQHFPATAYFGKCIFLSWYCSLGDCTFCYRSVTKGHITDPSQAKRSLASILVEALLTKHLNWKMEFLTGGYGIFPFPELVQICRMVSEVMQEKIWVNLGVLSPAQLSQLEPFVEGIVASVETTNPELHAQVCPSKPIQPFSRMLKQAKGFKKGMTFIVGLGETLDDFEGFRQFVAEHNLDKITFYALKPVKGTAYEHTTGPSSEYYAAWVAMTRIAFPDIEIMAGITPRRAEDVGILLQAGANAVTKFSATKLFASDRAYLFEEKAKEAGREFQSFLTTMPPVDWDAVIEELQTVPPDLKQQTKDLLKVYLRKMQKARA